MQEHKLDSHIVHYKAYKRSQTYIFVSSMKKTRNSLWIDKSQDLQWLQMFFKRTRRVADEASHVMFVFAVLIISWVVYLFIYFFGPSNYSENSQRSESHWENFPVRGPLMIHFNMWSQNYIWLLCTQARTQWRSCNVSCEENFHANNTPLLTLVNSLSIVFFNY